ncbi:hypothetical protein HZ326_8820 [Fusarium oxysporum f. sp. albedinis]|nr:hypothetical protein HZ326_8820 [Fusarium oxysporum f. sp. albedinis]
MHGFGKKIRRRDGRLVLICLWQDIVILLWVNLRLCLHCVSSHLFSTLQQALCLIFSSAFFHTALYLFCSLAADKLLLFICSIDQPTNTSTQKDHTALDT